MSGPSRRGVLAAGGALAGTAVLGACARGAVREDLVVWHSYRGREEAAFNQALALWSSRRKGSQATARGLPVPNDAMADKITAAIPRGRGPDLFVFAHDRLGGWVEAGRTVEPLSFWFDDAIARGLLPGLTEGLTYRRELYGLPLSFKSAAMIYDRTLVPEPPRTTAELTEVAKRLTNRNSGRFGLAYPYEDLFYHAALQNGFGGGVYDAKRRPIINSAENLAAANLLLKWKDTDGILPEQPDFSLIQSLFTAGRAGIIFNGPWFLSDDILKRDVGVAPLPLISEAGDRPLAPWLTIEGGFMAASSPRKEEAWELLTFLAGPEAGQIMITVGGQLHASAAPYETPEVQANPIIQAFKAQMTSAVPMPNVPEMTLVWTPVEQAMKRFLKGESSPEAALAGAQRNIEEGLSALRRGGA
jgi:arabinogalactan oligomer/maltooligosaccharide transport system substrate-binding protein